MIKQLVMMLFVIALVFSLSTLTYAQESTKQDVKKDEKTELTKSNKETGPLQSISCGVDCGFMVRSRNEKELISIAKEHVRKIHGKKVSDKDVKGMIKAEGDSGNK